MKLLRVAAVAALTSFGGIFANAGNAAPAAGLLSGAPVVRTLATQVHSAFVEKAYYYRTHYWRHRHYWHRPRYWHRHHYWHGAPIIAAPIITTGIHIIGNANRLSMNNSPLT